MQTITFDEAKAAARKYFEAGKLTAQHPDPAMRMCVYSTGEYRCAIGAGLTDETIGELRTFGLNRGASVDAIRKHITYADDQEDGLRQLQELHDAWADSSRNYNKHAATAQHRFMDFIGIEQTEAAA